MAQSNYNVPNDTAPFVRSRLNDIFESIATNNSGPTEPATTFPNQWWYDTTEGVMKLRNSADTDWIRLDISPIGTRVRLDGSGTYTVPAGVTRIRVYIVGGGGCGGASGGFGGNGGTSSFGGFEVFGGGTGGPSSPGSGALNPRPGFGDFVDTGCAGNAGSGQTGGGSGGFGGGGRAGQDGIDGGGGGAGSGGFGGGGGGLRIREITTSPGATFSYSAGAGGTSGVGGASGGDGFIIVEF